MIIYNKFIPFKGFKAMNFFGIIFARKELNEIDINHEKIHTAQMKDLLFIGFYIWYLIEWIWNLFEYRNFIEAYKHISFEKEAYAQQDNMYYLSYRDHFEFLVY
jgi:hypothetical protein